VAAGARAAVACELDEVDPVDDRHRPREVGEEDEARLQARNEERFSARVVLGDLRAELADAVADLVGGEIDLADSRIGGQEARSRWYRCPRRSMSRL